MFYVCWRSKLTGITGQGNQPVTRQVAEAWITEGSQDCDYWLKEV